ncbi:hypothetical protein [Geitlerinema sp. PCC 7407]|uniref:hypothetical protein n=1 Tax=Geitlerinema sp. PCC 7407 TaxID=1173025 RepID=UPI00029FC3D1|nr:hypothetical protein [Geitlerinema sp. PCC 7407]AFY68253.1 hypothetical protein GEI7407_3786 [Geitlerinema sp. PCC 7407]
MVKVTFLVFRQKKVLVTMPWTAWFPISAIALGLVWPSSTLAQADSPLVCPQTQTQGAYNTAQEGSVIVLGRPANHRYVVIVPAARQEAATLAAVRRCVPDAFRTSAKMGTYVNAGAFERRSDAEDLAELLRLRGLDARVVYARELR